MPDLSDRPILRKRRCGTGPNKFRAAMMACGLNITSAASYLDAPMPMVQEWAGHGDSPVWAMRELEELYRRMIAGEVGLPAGPDAMQELLQSWGVA